MTHRPAEPATTDRPGGRLPPDAVVAVDGPAGSGKSTTARALAETFGLTYIDTGAMYRALTWGARAAGVGPDEEAALASLLREARLELRPGRREAVVHWNGRDISAEIRTPEIEAAVSRVASQAAVRREMVERQRKLGRLGGVVMEGRDIGSVVFPLATAKLYLDASLEARTPRRLQQFRQRGQQLDAEEVRAELADRDRQDSSRSESPLRISPDAVVLHTSGWTGERQVAESCAAVLRLADLARPRPPWAGSPSARLPQRYRVAFAFFKTLGRFYGLQVYGRQHLDLDRGAIIACNHISNLDPPILGATLDIGSVRTLAKEELFRPPPLDRFFAFFDAVPIKRCGYDHEAFGAVVDALAADQNVLIFPEGTRRPVGRPGPVRSGLGIIMQQSLAPAVPVFVRGTQAMRPLGNPLSPLEVNYAPPVRLHALAALRRQLDDRTISQRIGDLFQAIYEEMQARSCARRPLSELEREIGARLAERFKSKDERLFGDGGHRLRRR